MGPILSPSGVSDRPFPSFRDAASTHTHSRFFSKEHFAIVHKTPLHDVRKEERDKDVARRPTNSKYTRKTAAQLYQRVASAVERIMVDRWWRAHAQRRAAGRPDVLRVCRLHLRSLFYADGRRAGARSPDRWRAWAPGHTNVHLTRALLLGTRMHSR